MFKYFYIIFFIIVFCFLIFRSLWYEVARLTNYLLIKILDENKKYKSKSKKIKLKRSKLQNFFFKDISHFLYQKEAIKSANFITILFIVIVFLSFFIIFLSQCQILFW